MPFLHGERDWLGTAVLQHRKEYSNREKVIDEYAFEPGAVASFV